MCVCRMGSMRANIFVAGVLVVSGVEPYDGEACRASGQCNIGPVSLREQIGEPSPRSPSSRGERAKERGSHSQYAAQLTQPNYAVGPEMKIVDSQRCIEACAGEGKRTGEPFDQRESVDSFRIADACAPVHHCRRIDPGQVPLCHDASESL